MVAGTDRGVAPVGEWEPADAEVATRWIVWLDDHPSRARVARARAAMMANSGRSDADVLDAVLAMEDALASRRPRLRSGSPWGMGLALAAGVLGGVLVRMPSAHAPSADTSVTWRGGFHEVRLTVRAGGRVWHVPAGAGFSPSVMAGEVVALEVSGGGSVVWWDGSAWNPVPVDWTPSPGSVRVGIRREGGVDELGTIVVR